MSPGIHKDKYTFCEPNWVHVLTKTSEALLKVAVEKAFLDCPTIFYKLLGCVRYFNFFKVTLVPPTILKYPHFMVWRSMNGYTPLIKSLALKKRLGDCVCILPVLSTLRGVPNTSTGFAPFNANFFGTNFKGILLPKDFQHKVTPTTPAQKPFGYPCIKCLVVFPKTVSFSSHDYLFNLFESDGLNLFEVVKLSGLENIVSEMEFLTSEQAFPDTDFNITCNDVSSFRRFGINRSVNQHPLLVSVLDSLVDNFNHIVSTNIVIYNYDDEIF